MQEFIDAVDEARAMASAIIPNINQALDRLAGKSPTVVEPTQMESNVISANDRLTTFIATMRSMKDSIVALGLLANTVVCTQKPNAEHLDRMVIEQTGLQSVSLPTNPIPGTVCVFVAENNPTLTLNVAGGGGFTDTLSGPDFSTAYYYTESAVWEKFENAGMGKVDVRSGKNDRGYYRIDNGFMYQSVSLAEGEHTEWPVSWPEEIDIDGVMVSDYGRSAVINATRYGNKKLVFSPLSSDKLVVDYDAVGSVRMPHIDKAVEIGSIDEDMVLVALGNRSAQVVTNNGTTTKAAKGLCFYHVTPGGEIINKEGSNSWNGNYHADIDVGPAYGDAQNRHHCVYIAHAAEPGTVNSTKNSINTMEIQLSAGKGLSRSSLARGELTLSKYSQYCAIETEPTGNKNVFAIAPNATMHGGAAISANDVLEIFTSGTGLNSYDELNAAPVQIYQDDAQHDYTALTSFRKDGYIWFVSSVSRGTDLRVYRVENETTVVRYDLAQSGVASDIVDLSVFEVDGRTILVVISNTLGASGNVAFVEISVDASGVPSIIELTESGTLKNSMDSIEASAVTLRQLGTTNSVVFSSMTDGILSGTFQLTGNDLVMTEVDKVYLPYTSDLVGVSSASGTQALVAFPNSYQAISNLTNTRGFDGVVLTPYLTKEKYDALAFGTRRQNTQLT